MVVVLNSAADGGLEGQRGQYWGREGVGGKRQASSLVSPPLSSNTFVAVAFRYLPKRRAKGVFRGRRQGVKRGGAKGTLGKRRFAQSKVSRTFH